MSAEQKQEAVVKPLEFFSENVDRWGAAEWFDRLAKAIREQDKAVVAEDRGRFEMYRMIAASSAMTLVREFEKDVRSALIAPAERERDALVEALSPSASTKAAYIGEFKESIVVPNPEWQGEDDDDEPEYTTHKLTVSWDTIKAVMAAISARAAAPERIVGAAK